jgi:hypothetical protein
MIRKNFPKACARDASIRLFSLPTMVVCCALLIDPSSSVAGRPQPNSRPLELTAILAARIEPLRAEHPDPLPAPEWISLFDGESLENWSVTDFGGQGEVEVKDGRLVMNLGAYMTGVTYDGKHELPKSNFEVRYKAARLDGIDFFCGFTFPVKDSNCSLILGGWGGGVCGLSSIDQMDASENNTTQFRLFNKGEWYDVRLMVLDHRILAWIDGERIIDEIIENSEIGIRPEVELSCPLGFATWQTTGAIESIQIRKLSEAELARWK